MAGYNNMYRQQYHQADLSALSFLVTGGAGFIGSHIVEYLLAGNAKKVCVLDNFSTGFRSNLTAFDKHSNFELIEGDIRDFATCQKALEGITHVSHQAALGSVPRSLADPVATNAVNVTGFLNMLWAAKNSGSVQRLVYASSSSVYGDSAELPKAEKRIGKPLSPYAVTKYVNELYADVFFKSYQLQTIGLRYFNVFGPRQSERGAYAAVIPQFASALLSNCPATINGDGSQTRDFTFVKNAVQANIRALLTGNTEAAGKVYNIACGSQLSLNELWAMLNQIAGKNISANYGKPRPGDVQHSLADITQAQTLLGYHPESNLHEQLEMVYHYFNAQKSESN